MTTNAIYWTEIGLQIHGEYHRAEPDCGVYAGWTFDGIDGMIYVETEFKPDADGHYRTIKREVDLFDGVNVNSPDIHRFIQNLHNVIDHDAARGEIAAEGGE